MQAVVPEAHGELMRLYKSELPKSGEKVTIKLHYFQCKVLQCSPNSAKYNLLTLSASFLVGFIEKCIFVSKLLTKVSKYWNI